MHRRALDHPYMAGFQPEDPDPHAHVYVHVQRLELYIELYDRAYRAGWWRRDGHSPFRGEWTWREEAELIRLRRELERDRSAGQASLERAELVRLREERRLRDGFLADIDRPGPLPPGTRGLHRLIDLPRMHHALRRRRGAMLLLDLPGQEPGSSGRWKTHVQHAMRHFAATRSGLPFRGHVALDVAVRGQSLNGKDLDNLVRGLLVPFEQELCASRGTVVSYRAYQATGDPQGVLIRILDDTRLLGLEVAITEARVRPGALARLEELARDASAKPASGVRSLH